MPFSLKSNAENSSMSRRDKRNHKHKIDKYKPAIEVDTALPDTQAETIEALKALSTQGVVAALRGQKQGIGDLLQNTDRALSIKLSVVYAAGLVVEANDDEWEALCGAEEWIGHPKLRPKRDDALRAVLRLAVGFDGLKANSSVHRYYKALQPLFAEKVPASELPLRIQQAGGIEKMRQSTPWSTHVSGLPSVLAKLQKVESETFFKLLVKCSPAVDSVTDLEILKVKLPKEAKVKKA